MIIKRATLVKISGILATIVILFNTVLLNSLFPQVRNFFLLSLVIFTLPLLIFLRRFPSELFFIILSLLVLCVYYLIGWGDGKLIMMIKFLFYPLLFYIVGLNIGDCKLIKYKNFLINSIFLVYAYIVVNGLLTTGLGNLSSVDRTTLTAAVSTSEDPHEVILFWPMVFVISNIGYINLITGVKNKINQIGLSALLLAIIVSIFFSTFSAVVMMVLLATVLYSIFIFLFLVKGRKNSSKSFSFLFLSIFILGLVYYSMNFIFSGAFGDIGGSNEEIGQILNMDVSTIGDSDFDSMTNNRWSKLGTSVTGFLYSPLVGNGAYYHSEYSGGHSFIFDTLSFFGVFGAIPIFSIFIIFLRKAYSYINNVDNLDLRVKLFVLSYFISTLSVFLTSILNPYLLHSSIDFIIFFGGGYISSLTKSVKFTI